MARHRPTPRERVTEEIAPHELEAERELLGALCGGVDLGALPPTLKVEDFHLEGHRALYAAIILVSNLGHPITLTTLRPHLLEHPPVVAALPAMIEAGALLANLDGHAALVMRAAQRRREIAAGTRLIDAAYDAGPGALAARTAVEHQGDDIVFRVGGCTLTFSALHEGREGVTGELTVTTVTGVAHWGRLVLSSTSAREGLVRKLHRVGGALPWEAWLETACREVTGLIRAGEPVVELVGSVGGGALVPLVPRLIVRDETNVIFADGGASKSLLALGLSLSVASGIALLPALAPQGQMPVLYLDWESTRDEHQHRLGLLEQGLNLTEPAPIYYRRMTRALADDTPRIRKEIAARGIGLVIVDSLAPASGHEPESTDAGVRTMNALRSLGPVSRLVVAHVSKAAADSRQAAKPFGSVFIANLARNVWELRRSEDTEEHEMTVALYHRKMNAGRLLPAFALRWHFDPDAITVSGAGLESAPDLSARLPTPQRILSALRTGHATVSGLALELDVAEGTVRKACERLVKRKLLVVIPGSNPVRYGLLAE